MGLFKSVRDLKKQADEINKDWDPAAQVAQAQAQMQAATESMAQQTAAANLAATGMPGTATIVAVRQGNAMVNHQPLVELDLTVMAEGRPPYPATVSQVMPMTMLGQAQPGITVNVKIDPDDPAALWIDWSTPVA